MAGKITVVIAVFCHLFADASWCLPFRKAFSDSDSDSESAFGQDLLVFEDSTMHHLRPSEQLRMDMYAANEPHPDKHVYDGDDAYFTSHEKQIFVINDGVSRTASVQLRSYPNVVSRILALKTVQSFTRTIDWRIAMDKAIDELQRCGIGGTTTTIVARKLLLNHRNVVAVYNLGDSRVAHLRFNKRTKSYEFSAITEVQKRDCGNHPFQISGDESRWKGLGVLQMDEYNFEVEENDLIIGASDGLWDVMNAAEIAQVASRVSIDALAMTLKRLALQRRENQKRRDDITVVIGHIVHPNSKQCSTDKNNYESIKATLKIIAQSIDITEIRDSQQKRDTSESSKAQQSRDKPERSGGSFFSPGYRKQRLFSKRLSMVSVRTI